jgi:hypothetical protein
LGVSAALLGAWYPRPRVVFMDPMYPSNAKRQGKSKKHAQLLQALCSEPCPLAESILLDAALIAATHRVRVVHQCCIAFILHSVVLYGPNQTGMTIVCVAARPPCDFPRFPCTAGYLSFGPIASLQFSCCDLSACTTY